MIARYTVRVTRAIEAAEATEDPQGNFVSYRDVERLERAVAVARERLGAAMVGDPAMVREHIGKALDVLERLS